MANVSVKSFGCSSNIAEGEAMQGLLLQSRAKLVSDNEAEVIILNVCTVKGDTTALREVRNAKQNNPGKRLIIGGCVTRELAAKIRKIDLGASIITTHALKEIVPIVEQAVQGKRVEKISFSREVKVNIPRIRRNPLIAIVPISSGCLDTCSFCSTRLVKGRLVSYPPEEILAEVRRAAMERCKEVWLTGQDNGCYGFDIGTTMAELLERIIQIDGDFKIRVGMGNPRHLRFSVNHLVSIMKHDKMFKFIHIPVQSGNEDILKAMRRQHDVDDYRTLVAKLRGAIPDITISTDIIVGFPGEEEEQFLDTVRLIKETRPAVVNLTRFVPRQGTLAATMDDRVSEDEKKRRSRILTDVFHHVASEENRKWIGWEGDITIVEKGLSGTMVGRNHAYKHIAIPGEQGLGEKVRVRIIDASPFALKAEIVKQVLG